MPDIDRARELDANDPLAGFREEFLFGEERLSYLDGNSLGRLPRSARDRARQVVEVEWGERLIRGWSEGWLELPRRVGDAIGALVGAAPGQLIVGDSTTVCFYKLAAAALDLRPGRTRIVTDRGNFPTDRYVLEALASARGLEIDWIDGEPTPGALATMLDRSTALVSFSHVDYRSARIAEMRSISALAAEAGALSLWDLSHSAGAVPVALDADGADLAVGCTYKYLNGGPGAPGYMYVREGLQSSLRQPIWGWLGRRDPFAMAPGFEPAPGMGALVSGTPPVLALACVEEGVRLVARAGVPAIWEKARLLTSFCVEVAERRLEPLGVRVASPRDPERRGAHVALAHPDARSLCEELIARGVIPDFREPDIIRVGLSPLSTSFVELFEGLEVLRELLLARRGDALPR
jgi:kynureninase